jgi:putative phage-type endonuclease
MSILEASTPEEWHEHRRQGIGGSDIAALLGLSAYASPTSLYYEKIGVLETGSGETQRQRIGKRMEAVLAEEFRDETGLWCLGSQTWMVHPQMPWARCTVDGFAADSPFGSPDPELMLGTIQMKTDGRFGWPEGVPANIRAQCIWEMGVCVMQHCYLVVMFAGFRVEVIEIPWDEDALSDWRFMLGAADQFWNEHVLPQVPPPVDYSEATTAALTAVHGPDPEGLLEADDYARAVVRQLQFAKVRTKAAEAEEATLSNELRLLLGHKTDLVDGWTTPKKGDPRPNVIASWRPQEAHRIDTTALRAAEPAIAEKFTTTTSSRRLYVPALKEPA